MDGVLEGAALVCLSKLAFSLLFLPLVSASLSAFSFCCSCLLLFTDIMVTTFLVVLWFVGPRLPPFSTPTEVITLRFLLFLSHTYWSVLLMTTPLIAVETAMRLQSSESHDGGDGTVDGSMALVPHSGVKVETGQSRDTDPERIQAAGREGQEKGRCLSHTYFLCCLLVWALSGIYGGQGLRLVDLSVKDCLKRYSFLPLCLPSLPNNVLLALGEPRWGLAALTLALLLVLMVGWGLLRPLLVHKETDPDVLSETIPATATSRCSVHSPRSGNNRQLLPRHHGDSVLLSVECLSAMRLEGDNETQREIGEQQTCSTHPYVTQCWLGEWGFPCLEVMTGLACLLTVCVLPLNLSMSILLIRKIEATLEWTLKLLLPISKGSTDRNGHRHKASGPDNKPGPV
ncbi:uncharacterized protein LOC105017405 isoform X2 [Esox lucius]|nr:uncharacterized protein LOC105017405 isoform X2 [Esox lucius]